MNFAELLYEKNKSFQFEDDSLFIEPKILKVFEDEYQFLLARLQDGKNAEALLEFSELSTSLEEILNHLKRQSKRREQQAFLEELFSNVKRLIEEDLSLRPPTYENPKPELQFGGGLDFSLYRREYFVTGKLSKLELLLLRLILIPALLLPTINRGLGKLKREELSTNSGLFIHIARIFLNNVFRKNKVLKELSSIHGQNIVVTGIAVELSVPNSGWWENKIQGNTTPPKTLYCHVDESNRYPKAIVYLSNVDEQNGPFTVYPGVMSQLKYTNLASLIGRVLGKVGRQKSSELFEYFGKAYHQSMNSPEFRFEYSQLPNELKFNSHFGWDVQPDSKIEEIIASSEQGILGPAGIFCVFNGGDLLHRGGLVSRGRRVALQVIFGREKEF